jgi:hypothetical protein
MQLMVHIRIELRLIRGSSAQRASRISAKGNAPGSNNNSAKKPEMGRPRLGTSRSCRHRWGFVMQSLFSSWAVLQADIDPVRAV